jgi:hypothetical protein
MKSGPSSPDGKERVLCAFCGSFLGKTESVECPGKVKCKRCGHYTTLGIKPL